MYDSTPELKEYIDNLVPAVKTAVLSPEWRKRVGEIGQKYMLNAEQISGLEYEVLFVLIGMEPEEDLGVNIKNELNVSSMLADQIIEDVNTRVFQYILKMTEDVGKNKEVRIMNNEGSGNKAELTTGRTEATAVPSSPLLSEMETMIEKTPSASSYHSKEVAPPVNLPGMEEGDGFKIQDSGFMNKTESKPILESNLTNRESAPSFADTKLNSPVTSQPLTKKEETPISHEYAADPYREPLE